MGFFSNHGTLANPRYLGVYTMNPQKQQGFGPPKSQVTLKTLQTCRLRDRSIIFRLLVAGNSCLRTLGAGRTNRTVPCTMWAPSLVISGVITPISIGLFHPSYTCIKPFIGAKTTPFITIGSGPTLWDFLDGFPADFLGFLRTRFPKLNTKCPGSLLSGKKNFQKKSRPTFTFEQ